MSLDNDFVPEEYMDDEFKEFPNLHLEHFDVPKLKAWLHEENRPDVLEVKTKILKNVRYVSDAEFVDKLQKSEENFPPTSPYAVILDSKIGKSKFWCYSIMEKFLARQPDTFLYIDSDHREKNINTIQQKNISEFEVVDDCGHSGEQASTATLQILTQCIEAKVMNPTIRIRIPFLTTKALNRIQGDASGWSIDIKPVIKVMDHEKILTLRDILNEEDIQALIDFVSSISVDIPLHFSAYYPAYKSNIPPTSPRTVLKACQMAKEKLSYVYAGNIWSDEFRETYCPKCDNLVISAHRKIVGIDDKGQCRNCSYRIYGVF